MIEREVVSTSRSMSYSFEHEVSQPFGRVFCSVDGTPLRILHYYLH